MSSAPPPFAGPPPEEPAAYSPAEHYQAVPAPPAAPSQRARNGFVGGLLAAVAFLLKFGAVKTVATLLLSFGIYAHLIGAWLGAGLVLMLLVHEMGHVLEIRRQGMKASAPLFIPMVGAAIFQRQNPTDALKQAQIGIAGPIAGTIGATAAFALYGATQWRVLLLWALVGFGLNLFNLIPLGMLDGGWIMSVVSKWFQVLGLALLGLGVFVLGLSWIVPLILVFSIPVVIERFRNDQHPYYQSVPVAARLSVAAAWLCLAGFLVVATFESYTLLAGGPR